jgi:hypothetical protein
MLDFMRWVLNVFLAVFFGWAALDRFYEGDRFMAVFKLITFWGCAGIACGASYLLNNVEMGFGAVAIMWVPVIFGCAAGLIYVADVICAIFGWTREIEGPGFWGVLAIPVIAILAFVAYGVLYAIFDGIFNKVAGYEYVMPVGKEVKISAPDGLTLHEEPSGGSKSLAKLPYGTRVKTTGELTGRMRNDWVQFEYNGVTGWIERKDVIGDLQMEKVKKEKGDKNGEKKEDGKKAGAGVSWGYSDNLVYAC